MVERSCKLLLEVVLACRQLVELEMVCVAHMILLALCRLGHEQDELRLHDIFLYHDKDCEHLEEQYGAVDGQSHGYHDGL